MGISFLGEGLENEVTQIFGANQTITSGLRFDYQGGASPHYGVDRLSATWAEQLFSCENDFGRMFLMDNGNNKMVISSIMIGAIANGDSLNLKPYIISEIVNRFLNFSPTVKVEENEMANLQLTGNFPDPFSKQTTIPFTVSGKELVQIDVLNTSGTFIKNLINQEMNSGEYSVNWDGTDFSGKSVQSGVYFYQIRVNNKVFSEKMMLIR